MSIQRREGEKLFLSLQLYDGADSLPKRVFARVLNELGVELETNVELTHVGGGEFKENVLVMPAIDVLTVHYTVYESDGVTEAPQYQVAKDVYLRDLAGEIIVDRFSGTIASFVLEADIESASLAGDIPEPEMLTADISTESLEGEICEC